MKTALQAWLVSRLLVLVAALAAQGLFGLPTRGVDSFVPEALAQLGGWDTTWYLDVAANGYEHDHGQVGVVFTNLAFFPLLPGLMALTIAVGLNPFIVALVVSHAAFLGALVGMYALTERRSGTAVAARATWILALAPPALYASLAYTEGIALACALAAALCAVRRHYAWAGAIAAAAALARPTGVLVALLIGALAVSDPAQGRVRRLAAAVVPSAVAIGAFLAAMALTRGSAVLPLEAQRAWDRGPVGFGFLTDGPTEIAAGWRLLVEGDLTAAWTATARDVGFLLVYAWLLVLLWRAEGGLRSPWVLYSAAVLIVPLSSGSTSSMARFGLLAFPLVWPLADRLAEHPAWTRRAAVGAAVLTVLMVAQLTIRSP